MFKIFIVFIFIFDVSCMYLYYIALHVAYIYYTNIFIFFFWGGGSYQIFEFEKVEFCNLIMDYTTNSLQTKAQRRRFKPKPIGTCQ